MHRIQLLTKTSRPISSLLGLNSIVASRRSYSTDKWSEGLNTRLKEQDPEMFDIIEREKLRLMTGLQLIPSENFTSRAVLDTLGSVMQNKYSEGYPGQRYYGGNENIDASERLCQKRALEAFHLDPNEWGVNVQPLSGSPANFYVYTALLQPHDRILAMDLPHGGHLSHGYQTPTKKISAVSKYFETMGYRLNEKTGMIDYEKMEELADYFRPKILICGGSSYSQHIDYAKFRAVADQHKAYLMTDMAHISGLVAAQVLPSPFDYSDVVTTTTHKSLRGPRGAMIFFRKGVRSTHPKTGEKIMYDLEDKINATVFPGHQGGPHNHTISALAVALKQATTPEFKTYQEQVVKNSKMLTNTLSGKYKYNIVSGGTENHLCLVNLHDRKIDGARVEKVLELCDIAVNKNTVPGDRSALVPGGIRIGTPAMTTRGLMEKDFERVAEFMHRGIEIAIAVKADMADKGKKKLVDFRAQLDRNPDAYGIKELRNDVQEFCMAFNTVGYTKEDMVYKKPQ